MINAIGYVFVSVLLARAMYTDVLWGRIENGIVGIGAMGGMVHLILTEGVVEIGNTGRSICLLWLVLYMLYWIGGLGAGDVKLMIMAGMWIPRLSLYMVAGAFVAGAVIACGRMLLRYLRGGQLYIRGETLPFAVPVACSFAGCVVLGGMV